MKSLVMNRVSITGIIVSRDGKKGTQRKLVGSSTKIMMYKVYPTLLSSTV